MKVGRFTYDTSKIQVFSWEEDAELVIGSFCSIAGLTVFLGGNHRTDWISTYPFGFRHRKVFDKFHPDIGLDVPEGESWKVVHRNEASNGGVVIGNDVWIGRGATIMSGLTVGDGAVIAANSHVIKDVKPYAIMGGNPAGLIRYRFEPHDVERLLEIRWWDMDLDRINELTPILSSGRLDLLYGALKNG